MAADPKDPSQPDVNVFVSQLCEELRALKTRINFLETQTVRAPGTEVLSALPIATARMNKLLSFDAAGNAVATAPATGDVSEFALEIAARLKRDGSQAMLGELTLSGNAVNALGAVPKQQVDAVEAAVRKYVQEVGSPKVAQLFPYTYTEEAFPVVTVKLDDGRLLSWGYGAAGGLGTGTNQEAANPPAHSVFVPAIPSGVSISGWVSAGGQDLWVWLSNGWCYYTGENAQGQGGHGDTVRRFVLTRIEYFVTQGLSITDVKAANYRMDSAAYVFAHFLTSTGKIYFAGRSGGFCPAGDGNVTDRNITTPAQSGTLTGMVGIANGGQYNSALYAWDSAGVCYVWGSNINGQLGLGDTTLRSVPTLLAGALVQQVVSRNVNDSVGNDIVYSLFLLKDGTVKAAGYNTHGQLGNGTTVQATSLVTVAGLANIKSVGIAGGQFGTSWAVDTANVLWLWGHNDQGQCGLGDLTTPKTSAAKPVGWFDVGGAVGATVGDPPFQGKIHKVVASKTYAGGGIGSSSIYVLDTDGNLWMTGKNQMFSNGTVQATTFNRFCKVQLPPLQPGDKVVDVSVQGHCTLANSELRLFALTQQGKLLACGKNWYLVCSAGVGTAAYNVGLQQVPIPN